MGAGDYGNLFFAWVYASDDAVPIGGGDPKYKWGMKDVVLKKPDPFRRYIKRRAGNSALPSWKRIEHLAKGIWIDYPRAREIMNELEKLLNQPRREGM